MDAQRKEVLKRILDGMTNDIASYSIVQAMSDLNDYYEAGTLFSAVSIIQKNAKDKERAVDVEMQVLKVPTSDQINTVKIIRSIIAAMENREKKGLFSSADIKRLNVALERMGGSVASNSKEGIENVKYELAKGNLPEMEIRKILEDAGFSADK
jgi:predicted RND superfamily exporter protein